MEIFVYSDESGVFDKYHNGIFVFGGLIFLSKEEKDINARKFLHVEKTLRRQGWCKNRELKACRISPKDKGKVFRSLNGVFKFGVVINQHKVLTQIFDNKKSKQRFLDYAYKIALKRAFQTLISEGKINPAEETNIRVYVDEHSTATNGRYELKEALEQELKVGTFNCNYSNWFPPIFEKLNSLDVNFCDSASTTLIRAADIVANQIYYHATKGKTELYDKNNMNLINLP